MPEIAGEAILVLSTDDKKFLEGLSSAKGKAQQWAGEAQKIVEVQGRMGKAFERVGVDVFGGQLLQLAGVSGQTRSIMTLLSISAKEVAASFGLATAAAAPWLLAGAAIAAISYKIWQGHKKHVESLDELIRKQGEGLRTNADLLGKIQDYEKAVGTLTPSLRKLKAAVLELDAAQRKNQETTLREQIATLEKSIEVQKRTIDTNKAYKSIIDQQIASGNLGQEAMAGFYLAQRMQNAETEKYIKMIPEENVLLKSLKAELKAVEGGYTGAGQQLEKMTDAGKKHHQEEVDGWKRVIKEVKEVNEAYKKNASDGAAKMEKAHQKLRAEWAKEDAAAKKASDSLHKFYGVGESEAEDFAAIASSSYISMTNQFGSAVAQMMMQGTSFAETMKNIWRSMAQEFISQVIAMTVRWAIFQAMTSSFGGGMNLVPAGDILGANGRASGGPVKKGTPYWVGENREPELFVPGQDGRIIPQAELQGRSEVVVNQTFNVSGMDFSSAQAARKMLRAQAAQMRSGAIEALTFAQAASDQAAKNSGRARG